jgi:pSer/pThr/pTyr-binding forkhead associated (FHA) protein
MATRRDAASPVLMRLDSESMHAIRLDRPLTIVGSKLHSHLRIVSPAVSGSHAVLLNLGNHVFVRDLMSRTHVFVNDREAATATQLNYGDVVRFGEMRFRFVDANVVRQSPARAKSAPAELHFYGRPDLVTIDKPIFVFGRQPGADLILDSRRVSKSHAVLYMQAGGWMLRDLGSRDGTLVNGAPIRTIALTGGEIIRIGRTAFTFAIPSRHHGDEETVQPLSVVSDPQADEPNESHVFVAEPVVVDDGLTTDHSEAPLVTPDPVAEFLADQAAGAVKGIDLVESVPALPGNEHADDAADLLNWGVVQGNVTASTFPIPPEEQEGGAGNTNAPSTLAEETAGPIAAAAPPEFPAWADPGPIEPPRPSPTPQKATARADMPAAVPKAVLSEPVDLEFAASPTSAANQRSEPPNPHDPLGDIVAQEVLTIYAGEDDSARGERAKRLGGRSRSGVFLTIGATLVALAAAAAGGAWFYLHRS